MLTNERIQELASGEGVKTIAVQNFLWSLSAHADMNEALMNLSYDSILYGWNDATFEAICVGIKELYER
jgi:hypothetical protein